MNVRDEDTGIVHVIESWQQYLKALEDEKEKRPDVYVCYGAHQFMVETRCGLTIRIVGASLHSVNCTRIGCFPWE